MSSVVTDHDVVDRLLRHTRVFGSLDDEARAHLADEMELRTAAAGDVVIRQGDPADGLYLVAGGRLQVVYNDGDGTRTVLSEEGYGSLTGEMALINDAPRSADVIAVRDCHLLFLSNEGFERVIAAHPHMLRSVTSALVNKLSAAARGWRVSSPVRSIVVVPLDDPRTAGDIARAISPTLTRLVEAHRVVDESDAVAALGSSPTSLARTSWFEQLEQSNDAIVYVTDPDPSEWTLSCLQQADVVVLVADATGDPAPREVEAHVRRGTATARTELVLIHPADTDVPRRTSRWLARRAVDRHHHVHAGNADEAGRVTRLLLNRGVGVVFGGGGARGIAHIGVVRALIEHGVPIDATGGTSIGSIIAGAVARGLTPDAVATMLRKAVVEGKSPVDLTLPTVSIASGERVTGRIREAAEGLDIEDGWCNCFAVSTNLTTGRTQLHRDGPGWKAIRASFSIPGVFPPVPTDNGEILIDGGILDNLPVGEMRKAHEGITVIAVDVGAAREPLTAPLPESGVVSGWSYLWSQLRGHTYSNLAGLPKILVRLTELGAQSDNDHGDCYLRPGTDAVSLLNFKAFDELIDIGHRDAGPQIEQWLASPGAPTF